MDAISVTQSIGLVVIVALASALVIAAQRAAGVAVRQLPRRDGGERR